MAALIAHVRRVAARALAPGVVLYVSSTGTLLIGTIAQLGTFVLLARYLGSGQFGLLMVVVAGTNLALQLCGVGAYEGMVRRVSRDRGDYPAMLGHALILVGSTGAMLTVAVAAAFHLVFSLAGQGGPAWWALLAFASANVLLARWVMLAEDIFLAHDMAGAANLVNAGFAVAKLAVTFVAFVGFGVDHLDSWALWHLAVHAGAALACAVAVARFGRPLWQVSRAELVLGLHFTTPWFFWSLRQNADLLVLGWLAPPAVVGAFAVAKRVVDTSLITAKSLARLMYPRLARAGAEGPAASFAMAKRMLGAILAISAATSFGVFVCAPWLPLLFGPGFAAAVPALQILCWLPLLTAAQTTAYDTLGALERHKVRSRVYNLASFVGAALIAALTAAFLLPGTFAGVFAAEMLLAAVLWRTLIVTVRDFAAPVSPRDRIGEASVGAAAGAR